MKERSCTNSEVNASQTQAGAKPMAELIGYQSKSRHESRFPYGLSLPSSSRAETQTPNTYPSPSYRTPPDKGTEPNAMSSSLSMTSSTGLDLSDKVTNLVPSIIFAARYYDVPISELLRYPASGRGRRPVTQARGLVTHQARKLFDFTWKELMLVFHGYDRTTMNYWLQQHRAVWCRLAEDE
jgi:hypothetical protein